MNKDFLDLLEAASEHTERLKQDILLCKTRDEHVRMTARANEAENMFMKLKFFMETASE